MDKNEVELNLHLDGMTVEKVLDRLINSVDDLGETFRDIAVSMSRACKAIQRGMAEAQLKVEGMTGALNDATNAIQELSKNFSLKGLDAIKEQVSDIADKIIGVVSLAVELVANDMLPKIGKALVAFGSKIAGILANCGLKEAIIVAIAIAAIAAIIAIVKHWDEISNAIHVFTSEVLPQAWKQFSQWLGMINASMEEFLMSVWNQISPFAITFLNWLKQEVLQPIVDQCTDIAQWFIALFKSVEATVKDIFYNIGVILTGCFEILKAAWDETMRIMAEAYVWIKEKVIDPFGATLMDVWGKFVDGAKNAWVAIKSVFGQAASFFKDVFEKAWQGVTTVFSVAGEIFTDIKDGILTAFKKIVNALIRGINTVIKIPFDGINNALGKIKNVKIFDLMPFTEIKTISVPQIPYLAKGAVLPANKPFLAMVGDQKHGTNIEAPLATIQEAVALVLDDQISALQAGFHATVQELQQLRSQVAGIQVGDAVIGRAANRYNEKMSLLRGY